MSFQKELEELINKHSMENGSDTPDFILAQYLADCLETYNRTIRRRDAWYKFDPWGGRIQYVMADEETR